jgi:hypothetical protein
VALARRGDLQAAASAVHARHGEVRATPGDGKPTRPSTCVQVDPCAPISLFVMAAHPACSCMVISWLLLMIGTIWLITQRPAVALGELPTTVV